MMYVRALVEEFLAIQARLLELDSTCYGIEARRDMGGSPKISYTNDRECKFLNLIPLLLGLISS